LPDDVEDGTVIAVDNVDDIAATDVIKVFDIDDEFHTFDSDGN